MKKTKSLLLAIILITLLTSSITYATLSPLTPPPVGGYDSGSNSILDPGCSPNAVDCFVNLPTGGSATPTNGLSLIGSDIGLGGILTQNTNIDQNGNEFSITNNGTTFASGADPLNLLSVFGQAYPGIGMSTDGTVTGGLQQWISAINDGSDPITLVGNFDFANNIQAGMIVESWDVDLSSNNGIGGNSQVSLRNGRLSLYGSDSITFNDFYSGRDDSATNFPTNFLYTDGSGNLQSAPVSLLGGGGSFSLTSQDEGSNLTSATNTYNFTGSGVTATNSGGLVTVNIPGGAGSGLTLQTNSATNTNQSLLNLVAGTNVSLADDGLGNITINSAGGGGGGADGSIYANDGTLTGNRILNGGGNDLTFNNLNEFTLQTNLGSLGTVAGIQASHIDNGSNINLFGSYLNGSGDLIFSSIYTGGQTSAYSLGIRTRNITTNKYADIFVNPDDGISFVFKNPADDGYTFPRTDGLANQVLATDGAGQLSWQNAGGASGWSLTGNSGTTAGTNFIGTTDAQDFVIKVNGNEMGRFYQNTGTSLNSVAFGGGTSLTNNMFVFGTNAGLNATNANNSNFFGVNAGRLATNAEESNFFGNQAGIFATNANNSNFFGSQAGQLATNANNSNFIGSSAGLNATNAEYSNFIGTNAGQNATDAPFSNFLGIQAGGAATNAGYSNFIGSGAGFNATNAEYSNFLGYQAGGAATNAEYSNFLGYQAGGAATNALYSNFLGIQAGLNATNAEYSNFIGTNAGQNATDAPFSNFLGIQAGYNAINANNSIFIGYQAGYFDTVNNSLGGTSILIGDNTSTGGFSNSIALGKSATNTTTNQFMIGSTVSPIDETKIIGSLGTECTITTGTGMACTSDERLKTNITDLNSDTLTKLQNVRTVSYNWLQNPDSSLQIGFLAQNLEQYFPEMVMTDATGKKQVYYSQMTPILTKAIQELNLKVDMLSLNTGTNSNDVFGTLKSWLGDAANGIQKIFAHEVQTDKLCVGNTCVTESQLQQLLQTQNVPSVIPSNTPVVPDPVVPVSDPVPPAVDPVVTPEIPAEVPPVVTE